MRHHAPSPIPHTAGRDEPLGERQCGIDCFSFGNGASSLRAVRADNESTVGAAFDPDIGRRLRERATRAAVDGEAELFGKPQRSHSKRALQLGRKRMCVVAFAPERRNDDIALRFHSLIVVDQSEPIETDHKRFMTLLANAANLQVGAAREINQSIAVSLR
jgi:hypothetical protein